jgi:pimeloyl-ACP methyl ester carboxylesterase
MMLNVNGSTAYAYTGGKSFDASLPTVVFIHGAQHDHSVWALQSRYLAHHGYGVLALDLPAHGRSDGPPLESVEAGDQLLPEAGGGPILHREAGALGGAGIGAAVDLG